MRWPTVDPKTGNVLKWEEVPLNNNNTPFNPNREHRRTDEEITGKVKEGEVTRPVMEKDVNLGVNTVVSANQAYWKNKPPQ